MLFDIEKLPYGGKDFCGVYKMSFDTGHFYIGSSPTLKTRFMTWRTGLRNRSFSNKKIHSILPTVSTVTIRVIEFAESKSDALKKEDTWISEYWGNPMLLNRCPKAKDHTGLRLCFEDIRCKSVAIFDGRWNHIETMPALSQISEKYKIPLHKIYLFFKGNAKNVNGFKFKRVSDTGEFIEPTPYRFEKKGKHCIGKQCNGQCNIPHPNCHAYRNNAGSPPKRVQKYSLTGELLATFGSIGIAAKSLETEKKSFKKQIIASQTGYARGYNWKVID